MYLGIHFLACMYLGRYALFSMHVPWYALFSMYLTRANIDAILLPCLFLCRHSAVLDVPFVQDLLPVYFENPHLMASDGV
jgi:hypothetical protein